MRRGRISLQLYTVRDLTSSDMTGTLRRLSEIGYTAVELAGYGGLSPRDLRAALDDNGLHASGAHVPLGDWETDPGAVLEDMKTLGCAHAIVPMALREGRSAGAVSRLAANLDRWGEMCRSEGVTLSYHNHDFEFERLDGGATMWEILLGETDPAFVKLELDLYWARYAGVDPASLLGELGDRVSLVHLKDMASDDARSDAPVGTGTMPWPELLVAADEAGVDWYVVEQDNPGDDPLEDVRLSLRNLWGMADDG